MHHNAHAGYPHNVMHGGVPGGPMGLAGANTAAPSPPPPPPLPGTGAPQVRNQEKFNRWWRKFLKRIVGGGKLFR